MKGRPTCAVWLSHYLQLYGPTKSTTVRKYGAQHGYTQAQIGDAFHIVAQAYCDEASGNAVWWRLK